MVDGGDARSGAIAWRHAPPIGDGSGALIRTEPDACRSCLACLRVCPARAIRVTPDHTEVIEEKCVGCGACVAACSAGARVVRDDLPLVRALLTGDRPVVVVLATEFAAAMLPMEPAELERRLERMGFHAVETTFLGEELVADVYERAHGRDHTPILLRSTCPVATRWVCSRHPELVPALAPILPPYLVQARLIRELYPDDVAIVYVSPCFARKDESHEHAFEGWIDVAIDFMELQALLEEDGAAAEFTDRAFTGGGRPLPLKEISLTDGFPRQTLIARNMTDMDVVKVRGIDEIEEVLVAVESGETAPLVLDMLQCDGCLDGPAVSPQLSVFAKRNIVTAAQGPAVSCFVGGRSLIRCMPAVDVRRTFRPRPVAMARPTDAEVDAVLAEGGIVDRDDAPDCGACGHVTCVEHAEAVFRGESTWDMCLPLQRELLAIEGARLEQVAMVDVLTGLWNRRAFNERLREEIARTRRYGVPTALLMLDLDGFKHVNDRHGHPIGDRLLAAMGTVVRENVRETDIPARLGGDEFAVILPGIGKTEAYAVAEKLRRLIASMRVCVDPGADGEGVSVRASIGVASTGSSGSGVEALLEAADAALYRAKGAGRDRVMLAPD